MTGGAGESTEAAPVVAASIDQSESALLRELVGESGSYREAEIEGASSELSELESGAEEEEEKKGSRRPNFVRAATGADRRVESSQDFFRHGNKNRSEPSGMETDNDYFATPGNRP